MASGFNSGANDPLAAARLALEEGELPAAARHVASALSEDPNRSEALSLLGDIITAAPDPLDLIPDDDLPTASGLKAIHAYILAEQGQIPEAVDILLDVITDRPDVLYIDWVLGWLQRPEVAGRLDRDRLAEFVGALIEQLPALTAPHAGGRETLTRMPLFIQLIRRTQPPDAHFLTVGVALLRRLGHLDEALKLAREAYELEPGMQTAGSLAATHAAREDLEQALKYYQAAIEHEPTDVSARLAMADLLVHHDRQAEARELFAEILERDPGQEVAEPSLYFLNFAEKGEESWRDKLLALAEQQPDNERAQWLAQRVTPYVGHLPDPIDVTARLQESESENNEKSVWLPYLEAPSNYLAYAWLGDLDLKVARIQKPDPRLPRCSVDYLLWKYDDLRPRVAVAPPTSQVPHSVGEIAAQPYQLDVWWAHARRLGNQLGPTQVDELLATMVYPPGAAHVEQAAMWVYRIQIAAAMVIAHVDEGWEDSVRRKVLLALASGPMDWTVDAALVTLAVLAREDEDAAAEVDRLFRQLRKSLPEEGTVCYYPALMWCSLRLPEVEEDEKTELRQQLRRWQDAREAEQHYRQALAHVEKGEIDPAIAELTETVELDPSSADAFRERAVLSLRRSDAKGAIADFTQAITLQPEMAAAHLGRGQAHLKLGRIDQAIHDFTEAVRLTPWDWQPWYRRGLAHAARKEHGQAVDDFTEVIRLSPELPDAYLQRAHALTQLGQYERAIGDHSEQIRLNPQSPLAYSSRGRLHLRQGNARGAVADFQKASELDPGNANAHSQLAWIWATCPDAAIRDGTRALDAARQACELTDWKKAHCLDALAAAYAESGRFDEAIQWTEKAVALALESEKPGYLERLDVYRHGQAWRER